MRMKGGKLLPNCISAITHTLHGRKSLQMEHQYLL